MTGADSVLSGNELGALLVNAGLAAAATGYAAYLHFDRRENGDYGSRAPVYTAIGAAMVMAAHQAAMRLLWPLDPWGVSLLLLAQFVIAGIPPFVSREVERRANQRAAKREAEIEAAANRARLQEIRNATYD